MPAVKTGLLGQQNQDNSNSPYAGGLQTDFSSQVQQLPDNQWGQHQWTSQLTNSPDADVKALQQIQNEQAQHAAGDDPGGDAADLASRANLYKGRIGIKNSLAEQIAGNANQERQSEDIDRGVAGQALGQGLKDTRNNYNSRGLLYSGLREGGENQVRGAVGSQLASTLAGTKRDSANSLSAAQNAYASVDLANQQESLNLAHQAFDTASQNSIARLQAMQQLGSGFGSAAGTIAASNYNPGTNPASGWSPQQLQMPTVGAGYSTQNNDFGVLNNAPTQQSYGLGMGR